MIEDYSNRMIVRETLVREGNRLIIDRWYGPRPEGSQGLPASSSEAVGHSGPPVRRGVSEASNSPEDEGADAPSQGK
jgi:hypothetical protein